MLEQMIEEKCWRRDFEEKRYREVFEKRIVELSGLEVRDKRVVQKVWKSIGDIGIKRHLL